LIVTRRPSVIREWFGMSKKPRDEELKKQIETLQRELEAIKRDSRRSLEVLEESEKRFQTVFECTPVPTALARLSDNELVDFNPAMMELTGYGRDEIVGKSATDLNLYVKTDTRARLLEELRANHKVKNFEFQIRTKSGEILDLLYSGVIIRLQDQPHLVSMAVDITERKELEAALKASEESLQQHKECLEALVQERTRALHEQSSLLGHVLANIPAAVFWKNLDSVFLGCNEQFAVDAGIGTAAEIVGKTDYELAWTTDESDRYRQADRGVIESGRAMSAIEEIQHRADGTEATVLTNKVPLHAANGSVVGVLGTYMDITDRKKAEEERLRLLEENRRLSRRVLAVQEQERRHLARELHDELGQNLVAVLLNIKLLCDGYKTEDGDWLARSDKIRQLTGTMVESLQGILRRLWPEVLDSLGLATAIKDMVEQWRFRHADVACDFTITGELKGLGEDINLALYRTVQECLTNIEKYAEASEVHIRLERVEDRVQLSIRDNGRGMDLSKAKKGMGMIGMRERVGFLNGSFDVESTPGNGVGVFVVIPT